MAKFSKNDIIYDHIRTYTVETVHKDGSITIKARFMLDNEQKEIKNRFNKNDGNLTWSKLSPELFKLYTI